MDFRDFVGLMAINELAEKLGVKPATVKRWFKGQYITTKNGSYISLNDVVSFICDNAKYAERLTGMNDEYIDKHSEMVCMGTLISRLFGVLPLYVPGLPEEFTGTMKINTKIELRTC